MWSLGVIAYILLSGIPPFNGSTDGEIMSAIKKGKYSFNHKVWSGTSEAAKDFIS
jgi:calcium-dependent protein kinase